MLRPRWPIGSREAVDEGSQEDALRECGNERTLSERLVPERLVSLVRFKPELKYSSSQDEPCEDEQDRQ